MFKWKAKYKDGTIIESKQERQDLDRTNLVSFSVFIGERTLTVHFSDDRKPIIRSRDFVTNGKTITILLVGWHANINGKSVKSICYIYENGDIEFDDARNDLQLLPSEEF